MPAELRDDERDPGRTRAAVAERIKARTADEISALFSGHDVCCAIVASLEEALADTQFAARGVFARELSAQGKTIAALPVPVADDFRAAARAAGYPELGEDNDLLNS